MEGPELDSTITRLDEEEDLEGKKPWEEVLNRTIADDEELRFFEDVFDSDDWWDEAA